MANRYFNQFPLALEKKVCNIFLRAAIGSSGAVTIDATNSKGVVSITKQATAGQYKIIFGTNGTPVQNDIYNKLLQAKATVTNATGIPAAPDFAVLSTASTLGATGTAASSIFVQFSSGGVATNLASGDEIYLQFIFGDSTAP